MKKILLIRFSSIGDIVLTSPVIRCIKRQIPDAELHFATKEVYLQLIANNPYIDRIHIFCESMNEIIPQLQKENFYHVVDLHKNIRSLMLRSKLKKPTTSYPKLSLQKWLMVNFRINLLPNLHIVDRYFKAVSSLGVKNDGMGLEYYINPYDEVFPDQVPAEFRSGYVGFAIGGKNQTKMLPLEKIIAICQKINKPVILLGGIEDREKGEKVVMELGQRVFNACGLFNLNQSVYLIKQAEMIIAHDTGLMHIAAALKKKIISVWGNTIPGLGMFPYFPERLKENYSVFEVKNLSCRPCSKLGYNVCPAGHFKCMLLQDEEAIATKANS